MTTSSHHDRDGVPPQSEDIVIYSHSPILYWWPVWLYGAFCYFLTWFDHVPINPGGLKDVNVFPHPWLGVSFVCVFFFVVTFSHLKMRGHVPFIVVLAVVLLGIGVQAVFGLDQTFRTLKLLFIYANEAFYGAVALYMFVFWCIVVFVVDHMTSYHFMVGQIIEKDLFGGENTFRTHNMNVGRPPVDIIRHKILGLAFLGIGTGDFTCTGDTGQLVFDNVVRLDDGKYKRIQDMIRKAKMA